MLKISPDDIVRGKVFANRKGQTRLVIGWVECSEDDDPYLDYLDGRSKSVVTMLSAFRKWADHEVSDFQHRSELGRCPCCSSVFAEWHFEKACAFCHDCDFVSPSRIKVTGKYRPATKKQALQMWRNLQGAVGLWSAHQPIIGSPKVTTTTFSDHKPEVTWL